MHMRFLQQLFYKLQQFMYGRYGAFDAFSIFVAVLYILIAIVAQLARLPYLAIINYLLLLFILYRMLSKNISRRQRENQKFLQIFSMVTGKLKTWKMILTDREHRYFRCPKCSSLLRIPKSVKHKKIELHCKNCGNYFIKKT